VWREMSPIVQMAWEARKGLLLDLVMCFSQFGLKTGHYMFSYRMSPGCPSSPTRSPVFLQEHARSIGSGLKAGMDLGEDEYGGNKARKWYALTQNSNQSFTIIGFAQVAWQVFLVKRESKLRT